MTIFRSDELLEQAFTAFVHGKQRWKEFRLESGRLLHQFVLAYLSEGAGLTERQRLTIECYRAEAINRAATRLSTRRSVINDLICVAMIVEHLANNSETGGLSWTAILNFRQLVSRKKGPRWHNVRSGEVSITQVEEWQVKDGYESEAPALFRQGVSENWNKHQVSEKVNILLGIQSTRIAAISAWEIKREEDLLCEAHRREEDENRLAKLIANSSPGDSAELLALLLKDAADPELILEITQEKVRRLSLIRKRKELLEATP